MSNSLVDKLFAPVDRRAKGRMVPGNRGNRPELACAGSHFAHAIAESFGVRLPRPLGEFPTGQNLNRAFRAVFSAINVPHDRTLARRVARMNDDGDPPGAMNLIRTYVARYADQLSIPSLAM